jgi:hypothetical protein
VIPIGAELSSLVGSVEDDKGETYSCYMSTQATEPWLAFPSLAHDTTETSGSFFRRSSSTQTKSQFVEEQDIDVGMDKPDADVKAMADDEDEVSVWSVGGK